MNHPILGLHYSPFELEEADLYIDRDKLIGENIVLISENYGDDPDQIQGRITSGELDTAHEFGWNLSKEEMEIILTDQGSQRINQLLDSNKEFLSSRTGTKGHKINFYDVRNPEEIDPGSPYHFLTTYYNEGVGETLEDKINNIFRDQA